VEYKFNKTIHAHIPLVEDYSTPPSPLCMQIAEAGSTCYTERRMTLREVRKVF
jgi:hypothetical protein